MTSPNQLQSDRHVRITHRPELEARLLYAMVVAGKSAKFADAAMGRFWAAAEVYSPQKLRPFGFIRFLVRTGRLEQALRNARTGNYGKLIVGFHQATIICRKMDLTTCTPADLERIKGVGLKTSRFFILWTNPDADCAALDTHVLKWLAYLGHDVPKGTPSQPKKYAAMELAILAEAKARGLTPRQLDLQIWEWCQARKHVNGEWPVGLRK